jgi:DNA-binding winged helix-turn-helix (wHTH) protein
VAERPASQASRIPAVVGIRSHRFGSFALLESTRSLFDGERRVDLPPRYFDLLLLLIEHHDRVVTKDDLYESIWKDEIVTEGAIAQGIRFLRRALGDDARNPRFIRTVAKFGYQWIEPLDADRPVPAAHPAPVEMPEPSSVFVIPEPTRSSEIAAAFTIALERYASASLGSAIGGCMAGALGGLMLLASSSPRNPARLVVVLGLLGLIIGALGGLGVGFGLSFAESLVRRSRPLALAIAGGLSGMTIGGLTHAAFAATTATLFGWVPVSFGGAYEGLWVGIFTGLGYGRSTRDLALAAPRDRARLRVVATTALFAGFGAALGSLLGASFSAASVDAIATAFRGSELSLSALGSWVGEPNFGWLSRMALSAYEGLFFGAGLVYGLTRRPARRA